MAPAPQASGMQGAAGQCRAAVGRSGQPAPGTVRGLQRRGSHLSRSDMRQLIQGPETDIRCAKPQRAPKADTPRLPTVRLFHQTLQLQLCIFTPPEVLTWARDWRCNRCSVSGRAHCSRCWQDLWAPRLLLGTQGPRERAGARLPPPCASWPALPCACSSPCSPA